MRDSFRGCLLGGAVGDALGAPVEFMERTEILRHFGESGITEYALAYGRLGAITDDTQMTLFTAEGLLRARVRGNTRGICSPPGVIAFAYQR
ncbi:MAG: ADP-ribosylglycohydrolase family protein [Pseudomonas sp.]|nr:MAG: ADP-ribosylglycohydrolase family protein [Pseudomonas sp.]